MSESTSVRVQHWLDGLQTGDANAVNELIRCTCRRLEALVDRALAGFPGVGRFERTSDVLQNAVLRIRANLLKRRLENEIPSSPREFFALAARWIRDELIALLRHYYGPLGAGTRMQAPGAGGDAFDPAADSSADPDRLNRWTELHESVDRLDADERELFGLLWYHGLQLKEAAQVLQMPERTAKRRWREVRLKLREALVGEMLE